MIEVEPAQGKFRWLFRKRIRITLIGEEIFEPPVELHDQQLQHPEYRFEDCLQERQRQAARSRLADDATKNCRVLPVRALNEVLVSSASISILNTVSRLTLM